MRRLGLAVAVVAATAAFAPAANAAATLTVDDDGVQCPTAGYTLIQDAVNAAAPGDTINVCRGSYTEGVTIPMGKDGLSLVSSTAPVAAVVTGGFVVQSANVSIQRFRINTFPVTGIAVIAPGSTQLVRQNLIVGGLFGIRIGFTSGGTIRDNSFRDQTDNSISVTDAGLYLPTSANVQENTIIGGGGNGIDFFSAAGSVSGLVFGNTVSDEAGYGITTSGSVPGSTLTIKGNNSIRNGLSGIAVAGVVAQVENNKATQNFAAGIATESAGSTFLSNNARGNGGVDCFDSSTGAGTAGTGNTWTGNYGLDQSPVGICKP